MLIGRGEPVVYPTCRYAEHTPDIIENRILASALYGLRRFAFKREQVQRIVGKAWWALSELDYRSIEPGDCLGLQYHRLNQDYKAMHALCYALLKQRSPVWGPGRQRGDRAGLCRAYADLIRAVLYCLSDAKTKRQGAAGVAIPLATQGVYGAFFSHGPGFI